MLADSLFGLVTAAFPLPHLPPMEPDFIPAGLPSGSSIKLAIGYFSILVNFGGRLLDFQSQEYGLPADYTHRQVER